MGDLLTGSLFFAMHSCKYTTNNTTDGPKTKNTPNRVCRKYHSARNSHPPPYRLTASPSLLYHRKMEKKISQSPNTNQATNLTQSLHGQRLSAESLDTRKPHSRAKSTPSTNLRNNA
jgi:hypothetical protein